MVSKDTVVKIEPSVDWITLTCSRALSRDKMSALAHEYLNACLPLGEHAFLWSSYGYQGWNVAGMRWGRRDQDDLLSLSGAIADGMWRDFIGYASNVSRIDLAVTVQFREHQISLIREEYAAVQDIALDLPISRNYTIISSLTGGDTLYVGSRSSVQFGRLYDKGLESNAPEFANCHRWEVEFKKPLSKEVAAVLVASDDAKRDILTIVKDWFTERLVETVWQGTGKIGAISLLRKTSSDERSIEWLARQVAPTVARLKARGKLESVLQALDLLYLNIDMKGIE